MKKKICKTIINFSLCIFSILMFSCNNTSETKLVYTESETIKRSVEEREKETTWTHEIEADRLSERITRSSMKLGSDVSYTKDLFKISKTRQEPVYPEFSDFGSLDTRNLRPAIKEKLNNFCKSISAINHSGADAFFSKKYIFNYVFFINDLEKNWKLYFEKDYPAEKATDTTSADTEISSDENTIFTKWTFGQPFVGAEIMQIPVRFYASCGIIDVTVFLNSSGNNEIYQITIDRWKKV